MKKPICIAVFSFLFTLNGFSQRMNIQDYFDNTQGRGALMQKVGKKETDNATGSPYVMNTFAAGNINGVAEMILVKYNAYTDEIELNNGDDKVFILPKDSLFNTITLRTGSTYKYVTYSDDDNKPVTGYMAEKSSVNGVRLLAKEKIILMPEKQPVNGYGAYAPAKFERVNDDYYLQLKDNKIVEFPKNKKKLAALFQNQTAAIDAFFKTNKVSFKDSSDLIRITNFIATL